MGDYFRVSAGAQTVAWKLERVYAASLHQSESVGL